MEQPVPPRKLCRTFGCMLPDQHKGLHQVVNVCGPRSEGPRRSQRTVLTPEAGRHDPTSDLTRSNKRHKGETVPAGLDLELRCLKCGKIYASVGWLARHEGTCVGGGDEGADDKRENQAGEAMDAFFHSSSAEIIVCIGTSINLP